MYLRMLCYPCVGGFCLSIMTEVSYSSLITVVVLLLHSVTISVQFPADKLAVPVHALDCLDKIQSYKSSLTSIKQY